MSSLSEFTVLDLTQVLAGPFCSMLLAGHGANVIKVGSPEGDLSRTIGPFFADDHEQAYSGYFQSINRNKRGIVLALKTPRDRNRFKAMAAKVDVVIENFRVGVMERLIYAAIRGFGCLSGFVVVHTSFTFRLRSLI